MRRILPVLLLLILASTPILDGGCFTYNQISSSRKEVWSDLRPPCAAYVGGDGSLTLVLPDGDDLAKAHFFAARFSAEEVKAVATPEVRGEGTLRLNTVGQVVTVAPQLELAPAGQARGPDSPPVANHIELDGARLPGQPPVDIQGVGILARPTGLGGLTLSLSRKSPRIAPLAGVAREQWAAGLPPASAGGYWVTAGTADMPAGFVSRYPLDVFQFGVPRYLPDTWYMRMAGADGTRMVCRVERKDGIYMAPTAGQFLVPVTLVADAVTLPIQLIFLIGAGVDSVSRSSGSAK